MKWSRLVPILQWGRHYDRASFSNDLLAALIVTIMLIPQSLAYAMLAGLPPEAGLYASIVPIILYAIFGTSCTLAVGPVAVVSLMTAAALGQLALDGIAGQMAAALLLALLSGLVLLLMGVFRLGFLANFLSHPVIAGFISASGILIALGQLKHLLGIAASGHALPELLHSLWSSLGDTNLVTLSIGLLVVAFLYWVRHYLQSSLRALGLSPAVAAACSKAGPVLAVIVSTAVVAGFGLERQGVAIVGEVPKSLPPLTLPPFDASLVQALFVPALLISLIGFVESISVAQTLAAKRRQRIDPDQELIGLGAANLGAAFTGGYPVTGGFSRSVVNFDAGAETPAAGIYTAVGLAIASLFLTPLLYFLPKATLAATIIVAVLSLVDLSILRSSWNYSRADFSAVAVTMLVTLGVGVEAGVSAGVVLSILLYLYRSSRPHIAEVGLVAGTEHFRNIHRHQVITSASLLTLRIDESLYFANARYLEDHVLARVSGDEDIRDVVLMCSAINDIDFSALESLEMLNTTLQEMHIRLHLSEVKGPVMDKLERTHFIDQLGGEVFLSQFAAFQSLAGSSAFCRN